MNHPTTAVQDSTVARPALVLLAALALAGCAGPQTRGSGSWESGVPHDLHFSKVLVVGVSPDVNTRCMFERFLVSRLNGPQTRAISSCNVIEEKNPLTRESIEAAVASTQADAVIATILIARAYDAKTGGSRDTRGSGQYKATDSGWANSYWGMYGVPVVYGEFATAPPVTTVSGEVQVETRVYQTHDPKLVYVVETKAKGLETRDSAFATIATPIAKNLRDDGLVR